MCDSGTNIHRITCAVRRDRSREITELLSAAGVHSMLRENGRNVRRRRRARPFGLPGYTERLDNSPIERYQFNVAPDVSETLISRLADILQLNLPGHGTIYAQEVREFITIPNETIFPASGAGQRVSGLLNDLAVITCIMSMSGSGEHLARLALELGTGVPTITLGSGTGLRDRLGLLRIAVPAEKELVRLLVPGLDAEGLMRMLIEKGHLNRPGKGFIYCTPVLCGLLDTSLVIGPQEHAATMEQVVAAIDELEQSTAWRRRFPKLDPDTAFQLEPRCDEITLVCLEEATETYVRAAVQAGAGAATKSHLHRVALDERSGGVRERCTIIVRNSITDRVVDALKRVHENNDTPLECLEVQPVGFSFSYSTEPSRRFH